MTKTEVDLGTMSTLVVGGQHYSARPSAGDSARLIREPDNAHDPNAIRVDNMTDKKAGHLPREVAAWLAPLLDAGKVRVEGAVGAGSEDLVGLDRSDELLGLWKSEGLDVRVVLCEAGRGILDRNVAPATADEAFHEIVRDAWKRTGALKDPEVVAALGRRLSAMATEDVPTETRLLLALLPGRGRFVRDRMVGHSVRSLKTMLSGLEMMSPVSCDGQGRWGRAQRAASGSWAAARLRRAKLEGVISSRERTGRPRSDQGRVWDEVTGSLSRLRVHSSARWRPGYGPRPGSRIWGSSWRCGARGSPAGRSSTAASWCI